MKTKPDYTEYNSEIGGEVRYYESAGKWRYVHAQGEGSGLPSLEAAQAEVKQFASIHADE
jgi:hypothetical protein